MDAAQADHGPIVYVCWKQANDNRLSLSLIGIFNTKEKAGKWLAETDLIADRNKETYKIQPVTVQ